MNRKILYLLFRQYIIFVILLLFSISTSLVRGESLGLGSVIILAFYFLMNLRNKNIYKLSFIIALMLLILAVILYVLDVTNALFIPIRNISDWSYLFLFVGAIQLLIYTRGKS